MKVMTQFHERLRAQAETSQLAIRWRGLPARDRLALLWLGAFQHVETGSPHLEG
ncbi:hypothetical protein ACLBV4_34620, partial [Pseudomonas aeruginosa]